MIIVSLITIGIIIYFFIYKHRSKKNSDNIFSDVNIGHKCYSCKGNTNDFQSIYEYVMVENINMEERLCKCNSCNRDDKLHLLVKHSKYKIYLSRLKKELYKRKSYLINGILLTHFIFVIISATSMVYNLEYLRFSRYVYPPLLMIAWILILFKTKLSNIKKPSI